MFNLKSLLFGGGPTGSPSSVSGQKEEFNKSKILKNKTKETAQNLVKLINDESLETFSKNATHVEVLGAVYNMMVKIHSDNKLQEELENNKIEQKERLAQRRHEEIVKALSSLSFGVPKVETPRKPAEEESIIPVMKPGTSPSKKPKGGTPEKPSKVEKTTPSKPTKQTPKKDTKTTPTAPPKVSGAPPVPSVGAGAAKAAVGVGLLGSVSTQMARAESGTGPQAYTQANIVAGTKPEEHQIVRGATDVTTGEKFTKDLTEMTIGEVVDLGNRRLEHYKKRGGSAMGRYQFIPGTLKDQAMKAFGENWSNIPFSKDNQDALNGQFIKSNAQTLADNGVPVNTASLYMMHFLGNVRKVKQILSSEDDARMSTILSPLENQMNPSISRMTVGEYKEHLSSKGYTYENIDNKALQSEPLRPAESINTSSLQNRDLNESLSAPVMASNVINQNNYNMYQPQHRPTQQNKIDDRSAFERKSRTA